MTTSERQRFPVGLTVAAAIGLSILIGLGVWQLQRLAWKRDLLARVAALQAAPARPIGPVLERAAAGADVAFTRVAVTCLAEPAPDWTVYRYSLLEGQVAWRPLAVCRLPSGPYDSILVDRGYAVAETGSLKPGPQRFPSPLAVVGVLRAGDQGRGAPARFDQAARVVTVRSLQRLPTDATSRRPAPLTLYAERETPAPPGIAPAPVPADIPNRHLEYALTWFGLAAALAGVYLAVLWRRLGAK